MECTAVLIRTREAMSGGGSVLVPDREVEVFVRETSVARSEFYAAMQSGVSISLVLLTAAINYDGERLLRYQDRLYRVVRTYRADNSDEIQLNCSDADWGMLYGTSVDHSR